ncbi:MAG: SDR family oxidoreductase [Candidatus Schekmanbacteria bacterium]|nr:MAG: SDR family oxidoreductase [Candidatus Schekmanbacteria bacterium]
MKNIFDLEGKVAVVTGAGKGIGKALAIGLSEFGCDVVLVARTLSDLEKVADEIEKRGRKALPVPTDVSKEEQVNAMAEKTIKHFGKVDILVNNSGVSGDKPVLKMDLDYWEWVMSVNLRGPFLCSKAIGAHMAKQRRGKVINISSITYQMAIPNMTSYSASKAGLVQFTKVLALEWVKYNIQVNAVCPGYIRTPMNEEFFASEAGKRVIEKTLPMKRLGEPEELIGSVVYFASPASDFTTGAVLVVDGGQILGK